VEKALCSFLNAVLGGGEWAALRSGRFAPWKKLLYPLNGWLVGPQGWYGRFEGDTNFPVYLIKKRNSAAIRLNFLFSKRFYYGLTVMGFIFETDLPCPTSGMSVMGSETLQ
jgi:hypothetical protein